MRDPLFVPGEVIERDDVLSCVGALLRRGEAGAVVLGDPGLGKSTVFDAAVASVRDLNPFVARASELERDHPYGVVRQLFGRVLARMDSAERARVLRGPAALAGRIVGYDEVDDAAVSEFAAIHALYWLVVNLTDDGPVVIAVDDAHSADTESQRFLAFLARRLEGERVGLLVTARPREVDVPVREVLDAPAVTALRLAPFSAAAVAAVLGPECAEAAPAFHAATGGNPLLVALGAPAVRRGEPGVGSDVAEEIEARLARLGASALRVARALAAVGGEQSLGVVAQIAGVDRGEATAALTTLLAADVVVGGDVIRFRHPLIAAAVEAAIPPGLRAEAARVLAANGVSSEAVATQLLREVPCADTWTVDALLAAASLAATRGAARLGVRLLRRALAEPPARQQRVRVLHQLGAAESWVGDAAAIAHLREAHGLADAADRVIIAADLARAHALRMEHAAAVEVLEEALGDLDPDDERVTPLARMLAINALQDGSLVGHVLPWVSHLAEHADDPRAREIVGLTQGMSAGFLGGSAAECLAALEAHPPGEDDDVEWDVRSLLVYSLAQVEASEEWIERLIAHAERTAHERGNARAALLVCSGRVMVAEDRGDVADLILQCELTLRLSDEMGITTMRVNAASVLAAALLEAGRVADARAALAPLDPAAENNIRVGVYYDARARVALEEGQFDEALATMDAAEEHLGRLLPVTVGSPALGSWRGPRVGALAGLGRLDEARAVAASELAAARQWGVLRPLGIALRNAAHVAVDDAERIALLEEGVERLRGARCRLEYGYVACDFGAALRRTGKRRLARSVLSEALDVAVTQGSLRLADRAREELRAVGARLRRDRVTGPEALTPMEMRVAALARDGWTNREIAQRLYVTTKTVESHLGGVYRKLGIRGRSQLADALG